MDNLDAFNVGNCISYRGRMNELYDRIGLITGLDQNNEQVQYEIQIKSHLGGVPQTIRALNREIGEVPLSIKLLERFGFEYIEATRTFYYGPVRIVLLLKLPDGATVISLGIYQSEDGGMVYDKGQFHIFEGDAINFKNSTDWDANSSLVYSVNGLQNYSLAKYGHDLFEDKLHILLGRQSLHLFQEDK